MAGLKKDVSPNYGIDKVTNYGIIHRIIYGIIHGIIYGIIHGIIYVKKGKASLIKSKLNTPKQNCSFLKDEKGQIIILLSVITSMFIISMSVIYTQNILAGTHSSYSLLTSSKPDVENLRSLIIEELRVEANNNDKVKFEEYATNFSLQLNGLYASHGSYLNVNVYNVAEINGTVSSFNIGISYKTATFEYESSELIIV